MFQRAIHSIHLLPPQPYKYLSSDTNAACPTEFVQLFVFIFGSSQHLHIYILCVGGNCRCWFEPKMDTKCWTQRDRQHLLLWRQVLTRNVTHSFYPEMPPVSLSYFNIYPVPFLEGTASEGKINISQLHIPSPLCHLFNVINFVTAVSSVNNPHDTGNSFSSFTVSKLYKIFNTSSKYGLLCFGENNPSFSWFSSSLESLIPGAILENLLCTLPETLTTILQCDAQN